MRSHEPRGGRPRSRSPRRPLLESLESRELPSSSAATTAAAPADARPSAALVAHPDSFGQLAKRAPGTFLNPAVLRQVAAALYHPDVPPGTPTPAEIHRQTFTARWTGRYTIGPPRFQDRASTIHIYGVSGGSNEFLKGKFQIALFPPADPTATPTPGNPYANQITGGAALFGQNYLQSGSMAFLDLNGTPAPGSDPHALPTQLTWTYDFNTSAGPYAAPGGIAPGSGFTQGAGTLRLEWIPDPHPLPGTSGSGQVIVTFQGLINTSQIVSGVSKFIS
jgi:hypothetical protein